MSEEEARSEAFLTLLYNLLAKHVDSYTASANLLEQGEITTLRSSEDSAFAQGNVVMPDGNEYRIEAEWVEGRAEEAA